MARTRSRRSESSATDAAPEALRELMHEAVDALRGDRRGQKLVGPLECSYLRPAPTQEAAAELLGLPFSPTAAI